MSNKDEALRAREKAEELMRKADFTAARRFAVEAQKLDTSPENVVSGMIMVCDVHCAALEKSGDETDWYKILQVDQNADDDAIKKQFRKLVLLVHPDKNKLPGAESAFNFIKEAEDILLDTEKRRRHDRKRKPVFKPQQAPTKEGFRANSSVESISTDNSCSESYECEVVSISSEDEQETPMDVDDNSYGEDEEISQSIPFDDEEAESEAESDVAVVAGSLHDMRRKPVFRRQPQQSPTKEGFRAKSLGERFTINVPKAKPSYVYSLRIPLVVANKHFPMKETEFKISDPDRKRSWVVVYIPELSKPRFAKGWTKVRKEYPVAARDSCIFEILNRRELILTIQNPK